MNVNRITGSLLGLALGDAFGAPHEGGVLERALWVFLGTQKGKRRWTDDTQMTIDLIESLVRCGRIDQNDLARQFAQSYRWSRGYGPGAAKVLKRIRRGQSWKTAGLSVYRDGSFGNGGAMRAPAVGLYYANDSQEVLVKAASTTAEVTHAHPLGREGAVVIALTTALAYNDTDSYSIVEQLSQRAESPEFLRRLHKASDWLQTQDPVSPRTAATELGTGIAADESCVTAVYAALAFRHASFDELLMYTIKLGGDVDTIAAMAGAIWGAARGRDALPEARLERLEQCDRLKTLAQLFSKAASHRSTGESI